MDKEFDLDTLSQKVSDDFKAAEQARAYVTITAEHGPSQQLIDFINFDGKLGEEIGLEGWNDFSTTTQHEVLLSRLNVDAMEVVAMEGLAEKIDKISNWMMGLGTATGLGAALGSRSKEGAIVTIAALATAYSGVIIKLVNNAVNGIVSSENFEKMKRAADSTLDYDLFVAKSIPTSFTVDTWQKYHDTLWKKGNIGRNKWSKSFDDSWDSFNNEGRRVSAYDSWDADNFKAAIKWLEKSSENLATLSKQYANHLEPVAKWVKENKDSKDKSVKDTMKLINKTIDISKDAFEEYEYMLERAAKALNQVSKMFKKKEIEK